MAHARLIALCLAVSACGGAHTSAVAQAPVPARSDEMELRLPRYHSTRFSLSIALPDGKKWRIDDHSSRLLHATSAETSSSVELAIWHEADLMNRQRCEEQARIRGYGERAGAEVDSEVTSVPPGWDALVWLGEDHDEGKKAPEVTGHLFAFASSIRKCLYFHYETRGAADAVAERLAFARLRILGDLRFDTMEIPRVPEDTGRGAMPRR